MFAEIVPINSPHESKVEPLSFALGEKFTDNQQINLVIKDKKKHQAIFVTQSFEASSKQASRNPTDNNVIDFVTFMKIVLGANEKLSFQQISISLPEKQVNAKVICTLSENEDSLYCYCFYQKPDYPRIIACKPYKLNINTFKVQEAELIKDVVADVIMEDSSARRLIFFSRINVFRLKQSLDDSSLLCWRPWDVEVECPLIFFLKLTYGKLLPNKDLGASVQMIDLNKVNFCI